MNWKSRNMLTCLLLVGAVLVQSLAAPSSSDLQTAETKWKKGNRGPSPGPGPGPYHRGLGGWGPYGPWGGWRPGVERFAVGYGPGFYNDPLAAFALGAFPGGVDPWGIGYSGVDPWFY